MFQKLNKDGLLHRLYFPLLYRYASSSVGVRSDTCLPRACLRRDPSVLAERLRQHPNDSRVETGPTHTSKPDTQRARPHQQCARNTHTNRPSTSTTNENTEAVKKIVMENRRITIREVAEDVGVLVGSYAMQFFRIFWV